MGKHASTDRFGGARVTHLGWHLRHRELVNLIVAEHGSEDVSVGNLGDDVWEWMQESLDIIPECDWCDCEVSASLWGDN